jgi:hypothetical protein
LDVSAKSVVNDFKVLGTGGYKAYSELLKSDFGGGDEGFLKQSQSNIQNMAIEFGTGANDVGKPKNKVDSILAYKDSKRKEYNFEFEFA